MNKIIVLLVLTFAVGCKKETCWECTAKRSYFTFQKAANGTAYNQTPVVPMTDTAYTVCPDRPAGITSTTTQLGTNNWKTVSYHNTCNKK